MKIGEKVWFNDKLSVFFGDLCKYEGIQYYGEKINVVSGLCIFDIIFFVFCIIFFFIIKKCNDIYVNRNLNGINCLNYILKLNFLIL